MKITIHFDDHFAFFFPKRIIAGPVIYELNRRASIKDIIESSGVPHTEIGELYFDDQPIEFDFIPVFEGILRVQKIVEPFDVLTPSRLRPNPLISIKFIADVNVIRLGRLLILLGFDVDYSSGYSDHTIARISDEQSRIVLTRDTGLLKQKRIEFAKRIQADLPYDQLKEVVDFFGIQQQVSFLSRCTRCNLKLESVSKEMIYHLLEPKTKKYFTRFFQCPQCSAIFWKGSHHDQMKKRLTSLGIL